VFFWGGEGLFYDFIYIVDLICVASFVFSSSVSFSVFVCVLVWMAIFLFWRGIGTDIKKKKRARLEKGLGSGSWIVFFILVSSSGWC